MRNNNFKSKTHCVFVTKFRRHILTPDILILTQLAEDVNTKITEINGESDHIHFLLETTPQDTLGSVIGSLKCASSRIILNKHGPFFYGKHKRTLWSKGYFISSTGGASIETIKKYIQNQS